MRSRNTALTLAGAFFASLWLAACSEDPNTTTGPAAQGDERSAAPLVTDQEPSEQMDVDDILRDLTEAHHEIIIGLKEPNAARGVSLDGHREVPNESKVLGEAAIRTILAGRDDAFFLEGPRRRLTKLREGQWVAKDLWVPFATAVVPSDRELIEALRRSPFVDYITPNYVGESQAGPPISVIRASAAEVTPWPVETLRVDDVWNQGYDGTGVMFAVYDSGLDIQWGGSGVHPDLGSHGFLSTATDRSYICTNILNPCYFEETYHGTSVYGIIGAVDNSTHVVGIAHGATSEVYKIGEEGGYHQDDMAEAILDIKDEVSSGDPIKAAVTAVTYGPQATPWVHYEAVWNALSAAAAQNKTLHFGAAGNNNTVVQYPASDPNMVAVVALKKYSLTPVYNIVDSDVELAAPGEVVETLENRIANASGWATYTGTSYAAPVAAAVAVLVGDRFPSWSASKIRQEMQAHAKDLGAAGFDNVYGYGMPDAWCVVMQTATC